MSYPPPAGYGYPPQQPGYPPMPPQPQQPAPYGYPSQPQPQQVLGFGGINNAPPVRRAYIQCSFFQAEFLEFSLLQASQCL